MITIIVKVSQIMGVKQIWTAGNAKIHCYFITAAHAWKKLVQEYPFVPALFPTWVIALNYLELHMPSKTCISKIEVLSIEPCQMSHLEKKQDKVRALKAKGDGD